MFAIVVDEEGFKLEFVILDSNKKPQNYELKDGESIVTTDWDIANTMLKPKWGGEKWVETETPEPIPEPQPTEMEILKEKVQTQETLINELLTEIIPSLQGGN